MKKVDLTYDGKIKASLNAIEDKKLNVLYTIDGKSGKTTTTSILIKNGKDMLMLTFNYQDLKKVVGDNNEK